LFLDVDRACLAAPRAIRRGMRIPGDAENLKRKFKVWLSGVTWGKTYVSSTNRASLASWQGDPWSAEHIMTYLTAGCSADCLPPPRWL
jgi:hypothetical protein